MIGRFKVLIVQNTYCNEHKNNSTVSYVLQKHAASMYIYAQMILCNVHKHLVFAQMKNSTSCLNRLSLSKHLSQISKAIVLMCKCAIVIFLSKWFLRPNKFLYFLEKLFYALVNSGDMFIQITLLSECFFEIFTRK